MSESRASSTIYVLPAEDVQWFAEAVQTEIAKIPLPDLFASIPRVVSERFRAFAYHAHRGGAEPAEETTEAPAAPAIPLRAPAPAAVPVAADTAAAPVAPETGGEPEPESDQPSPLPPGKKYHVRKGGNVRYPDIVLNEIADEEFDADEVWRERLEPIVHSQSKRALELFRRSLIADKRFERIGDKGYRFRRVVPLPPRPVSLLDRLGEDGSRNDSE